MKLRFGVLLLLIAASVVMQDMLGMSLLRTLIVLSTLYIMLFWSFNFLRKRRFETDLKPESYVKMNRLAAAYSRKYSKGYVAAKVDETFGRLDAGRWDEARAILADIEPTIPAQSPNVQVREAAARGLLALTEGDKNGAERALKKTPNDSRISPETKKEMAFMRALQFLTQKDKARAEQQIAILNEPSSNRQQLQRLFAYGWLLHQKGDREKAAQAMEPILEHGTRLWLHAEAEKLSAAARAGKEYNPWKSV